jgi:hydroxymethylbilane synthase
LSSRITEVLAPEVMLPAVGQGALGVEFCEPRREEFKVLDLLMDQDTMRAVKAERALLAEVQGGCRLPLGAWARVENGVMVLDACVLSEDGTQSIRRRAEKVCNSAADAENLGRAVAVELLAAGADQLLRMVGRSVGQA